MQSSTCLESKAQGGNFFFIKKSQEGSGGENKVSIYATQKK